MKLFNVASIPPLESVIDVVNSDGSLILKSQNLSNSDITFSSGSGSGSGSGIGSGSGSGIGSGSGSGSGIGSGSGSGSGSILLSYNSDISFGINA